MNVISTETAEPDKRHEALRIPIGLLNDLSEAQTRDETLQCFAMWSHRIVEAERCSVALVENGDLKVIGLSGNRAIPTGTSLPIEGSLPGAVYKDRECKIVSDPAHAPYPDARKLAETGVRTILMAPLIAKEHCFGTLGFAFNEQIGLDLDRLAIIEALARCLSTQLLIVSQIKELARLATIDPLTETYNRRHFYEVAKLLWNLWETTDAPFAVAAIDIDHFKAVNDQHGHHVGDLVLKAIATRLKKRLRDGDIVVRMGGEEFLLLLRNCPLDRAEEISTRMLGAIADNPIHVGDGTNLTVTISIGVAAVSEHDNDVSAICRRADDALYAAKSAGRNRVSTAVPNRNGAA